MDTLRVYLPQDRLRALARGEALPERTRGSALMADIAGFTLLADQLVTALGPRRGAEELTIHLNAVYADLIAEVERYRGSVISFAGDGITCWFDQDDGMRAAACALALQSAIQRFQAIAIPGHESLALKLKVAVTSGPVRRFTVGDVEIQQMDALGGATVARLALAERLARQSEVVIDSVVAAALGQAAEIGEWRTDRATNQQFAPLTGLRQPVEALPWEAELPAILDETLRPWVPPAVYARELNRLGEFLAELRPVVALFVRFQGINYDADFRAGEKLGVFIRAVQNAVACYGGTLVDLNIGDKGSYLYIVFGAPVAHEDDARRAVQAALDLQRFPQELGFLRPVQIGISRGTMWVGTYGGENRRAYTVLGDEVNLAARLMEAAAPGETLASRRVQRMTEGEFIFEASQPLKIKGKAEEVPVYVVSEVYRPRAIRLQEPEYRLPMIGRKAELALAAEKMALALQSQGQVIGIVGDAGMGKSRLVAEIIRLARQNGYTGYGSACQSFGMNSPYLIWKPICQAFFDLDPTLPAAQQAQMLESRLAERLPERLPALPLLGPLLDLPLEENDFTRSLEPKDRKGALEALLVDCLRAAARSSPLLLVLEDLQWLDGLSHDLMESIARACTQWRLLIVLAYRPPDIVRLLTPRVETLPHYTGIHLTELSEAEATELLQARLAQLFPDAAGRLPPALNRQLVARSEGNPFYLEELLNYLRDRGINPYVPGAATELDLPSSLHSLILSRLDQLSEAQKGLLKAASIIGRLFRINWLRGYYPALGDPIAFQRDLDELAQIGLTLLDTPDPELAYLFKHIITQEVTYQSLSFATRARLHEQLAAYLESLSLPDSAAQLDLLAYHYSHSENKAKAMAYLRKAGEAAQAAYANVTAIEYYEHLLELLAEEGQSSAQDAMNIRMKLARVFQFVGRWQDAEGLYRQVMEQAEASSCSAVVAECEAALGILARIRGDYDTALAWLAQAQHCWEKLADGLGVSQALMEQGAVLCQTARYAAAQQTLEESLALARQGGDQEKIAFALNWLGNVALLQGFYAEAQARYTESLALRRAMGDRFLISASLNNLGELARYQGDLAAARHLYEEGLAIKREIGDKHGAEIAISNLGGITLELEDYPAARVLMEESLMLCQEIGDKGGTAGTQFGLGLVSFEQGDFAAARRFYTASLKLAQAQNMKYSTVCNLIGLAELALHDGAVRGEGSAAQAEYASRLAGAAKIGMADGSIWLEPYIYRRHARVVETAGAILGSAAFELAWQAGQAMTLEQASIFALEMNQ